MKLFLDTNILIDLIDSERKDHADAVSLFSVAKANGIKLVTTVDVIATTAYYVNDAAAFRTIMTKLNPLLTILPITDKIIDKVNKRVHPDYEDSMHIVCAEENEISAILTRDKKHYVKYTYIPVLSESDFLGA